MKSIPNFDSSYSPNESNKGLCMPNCTECGDEGFIRHGVFGELKSVCANNCKDFTACYFCDTPMELETSPYRNDVCNSCAYREFGS